MTKFLDLISNRQSVRKYSNQLIEDKKLARCLDAARLAPSASNSQPWTFVAVTDKDLKEKVAAETYDKVLNFNRFVSEAPVILVFVVEKPKIITRAGAYLKNKEYPLIDIGIAAEHFCLQATEEGLGTCMIGWFNEQKIKVLLNIPEKKTIGLLISVGYAVEGYRLRQKSRKSFDQIVKFNSY
jgi:nitroreductase